MRKVIPETKMEAKTAKTIKFQVGDMVELKGANAKFRIIEADKNDNAMTYKILVVSTDKPVTYGPKHTLFQEGENMWVWNRKKSVERIHSGCTSSKDYYCPTADRLVLSENQTA